MADFSIIVKDYINDLDSALDAKLRLGLKAVGQEIEGKAKRNCPVDTGLLRNSITWALCGEAVASPEYHADDLSKSGTYSGTPPKDRDDELSVYVGSNVDYAVYVEYGDRSHKTGQAHFLRDAVQDNVGLYQSILQAALNS